MVNDVVFTATYDGTIYGFNATTGKQLFQYKASAGINAWPAVAGDTIIWPAGNGLNASLVALRVGGGNTTVSPSSTGTTGNTTGNTTGASVLQVAVQPVTSRELMSTADRR